MKFHKTYFLTFLIILTCLIFFVIGDKPCVPKKEDGYESVVCVCNSTYCDEISKIEKQPGKYILYTSSKDGLRFEKQEGKIDEFEPTSYENIGIITEALKFLNLLPKIDNITFHVNRDSRRQIIEGFGGAFTDSAAVNYMKMSEKLRERLIKTYFSENGLEYSIGRVPIGMTDFSIRSYTYNEFPENDTKLTNFTLVEEDYDYKIPLIKAANESAVNKLHLIGAAWTPPLWMKTVHRFRIPGEVKKEYWQTWADYHLKFLKLYEKLGVNFWGITTGNEPLTGVLGVRDLLSIGWYPNKQARWVADNLGPTIKSKENYPDMKIITGDENRHAWAYWLPIMSLNQKAMSYIDGMSLHWYDNKNFPPATMYAEAYHFLFKDVFLIGGEACNGTLPPNGITVVLGSWERAEYYIRDMIADLNHWFVGWKDWNLVLNYMGGPNWLGNYVDSPVLFYEENDEFVKQPTFFSMGHVSKFVPRGSVNINLDQVTGPGIENTAFLRPDGGIAVIFYNGHDSSHKVTVKERGHGQMSFTIPPFSINSLVYYI